MDKPENHQSGSQLKRLERRVAALVWVNVVQSVLLMVVIFTLIIEKLIPTTWTVFLLLALIAVAAYFCRRHIPGWFGSLSRTFFSHMLSPKSDSTNEE